jgi:site-specific DNA-methyltransferase (adenine-specific)
MGINCTNGENMKPYYEHAGIQIWLGDCREILPTLSFGSIVTDIPYGIGKIYGQMFKDSVENFRISIATLSGAGVPACTTMSVTRLFDIPSDCRPQWVGVWRKPLGVMGLAAYPIYPHWEPIAFWHIKGDYLGNAGHRSDVYDFMPERSHDSEHPTPKPESLYAELICHIGVDAVLDPFMGSGTTLVAAKNLGRKAIGIEIEEKYAEIAARRLEQEVLQFPYEEQRASVQGSLLAEVEGEEQASEAAPLLFLPDGVLPPRATKAVR